MASRRARDEEPPRSLRPAATTPEGRENQLIAAAVDLAERQLSEGTASAQVITHYLKLGSSREKLEQRRIELENQLIGVKMETLESQKRVESLFTEAINAFRSYSGEEPQTSEEDYDDPDLY